MIPMENLNKTKFEEIIRNSNRLGNIKSIDLNNDNYRNMLESNAYGLNTGNVLLHRTVLDEEYHEHLQQYSNKRSNKATDQLDDTKSGMTVVH